MAIVEKTDIQRKEIEKGEAGKLLKEILDPLKEKYAKDDREFAIAVTVRFRNGIAGGQFLHTTSMSLFSLANSIIKSLRETVMEELGEDRSEDSKRDV